MASPLCDRFLKEAHCLKQLSDAGVQMGAFVVHTTKALGKKSPQHAKFFRVELIVIHLLLKYRCALWNSSFNIAFLLRQTMARLRFNVVASTRLISKVVIPLLITYVLTFFAPITNTGKC